ncbi:MAG: lipoprotein insertase outer membrane protein LolB [Dokdonella sp.]
MTAVNLRAGMVRNVSFALLCSLLASCAAPRLRPDADRMSAQEQRERILSVGAEWSLQGRMAISSPDDSGSGTLDWRQQGSTYRFALSAPVSGKTWTLSGDADHSELTGLRAQPVRGANAADLLSRELGWKVPVGELAYWVRGIRAPGRADVVFREDGLPAEFHQDGWTIEFRDYASDEDPPLPRKIFASNGDFKVRLVIQHWKRQ